MNKAKDETGKCYGEWTVISRVGSRIAIKNNQPILSGTLWLCRCSCGNTAVVYGSALRQGKTKRCIACSRKRSSGTRYIDLTNQKIGRLFVLGLAGKKWGGVTWLCKCDCGKEFIASGIYLRSEGMKSCGCYQLEQKRLPYNEASFNATIGGMKKKARERNLYWDLTNVQTRELIVQPCHYCGAEPKQKRTKSKYGNILYNGLDRVDNSKGYILDNVVPCCGICNRSKGTMTEAEFKEWVVKVYFNFGGINE